MVGAFLVGTAVLVFAGMFLLPDFGVMLPANNLLALALVFLVTSASVVVVLHQVLTRIERVVDETHDEEAADWRHRQDELSQAVGRIEKEKRALAISEAALAKSENKLRTLTTNMPDLVMEIDREYNIAYINRIDTFVGEDTPILGMKADHYVTEEYRPIAMEALDAAFESGRTSTVRTLDAFGKHYESKVVPLTEDDEVTSVLLVAKDITDEIDRQRELRSNAARLVSLLGQLDTARGVAERAGNAKKQFLASLSHEIRTPLNGVTGVVDLLFDTQLDEEQKELAEMLEASSGRLSRLLESLLDFANVDAGRLKLDRIGFLLPELVEAAVDQVSEAAGDKGLKIATRWESDLPDEVVGDPRRLRQVLSSLLDNAVRFTPQGGVVIAVGTELSPGGKILHRFSVIDSGIGVDRTDQTRIFERFSQADCSNTREIYGAGIGLNIAAGIIHDMGGEIWLESPVESGLGDGPGSAFHFTVDLNDQSAQVAEDQKQCAIQTAARVLIVDWDGVVRSELEKLLNRWFLDVSVVGDAEDAARLIDWNQDRARPFELIVADARFLERDPNSDTILLGERPVPAQSRLIVLNSPEELDPDLAFAVSHGSEMILKPVKRAALYRALRKTLEWGGKASLATPQPADQRSDFKPAALSEASNP